VAQARDHYTKHGDAREALKIAQNGFGMIERNIMERLARNPSGFSESLMGLPRNMRSMYVHAYQSLVWNRAATARAKLGLVVLEGDLVLPLDVDTESGEAKGEETPEVHTVSAEDVAASRYSFDQVVLPLPGKCASRLHYIAQEIYTTRTPGSCELLALPVHSCVGRFRNGVLDG
jgi:tRNA pseudouridine13 synthase